MSEYIERANAAEYFEKSEQMMWHKDDVAATISQPKNIPTADVVEVPESGIGDLSDGYHTFNELYHHRAILFSVICNSNPQIAWKSKLHDTGDMFDGMFIVGIETPQGQATYHYDIEPYWDLFKVKELPNAPKWDGHTPEQAIERMPSIVVDVDELQAEIERLRKDSKRLKKVQIQLDDALKMYSTIKSEAVKEFAKRLCEGRVSNDPVVIAVKVELETAGDST